MSRSSLMPFFVFFSDRFFGFCFVFLSFVVASCFACGIVFIA